METSYSKKPYFFVPLAGRTYRVQAPSRQNLLAGNTLIGKLCITAICKTPLHFGSGQLVFDEASDSFAHSLLRENGKIALPGSSFKGMFRSIFEAVTESCVLSAPKAELLRDKVNPLKRCHDNKELCPACSIFGYISNKGDSHKGKLIISSFVADADAKSGLLSIPQLEQPFKTYPKRQGEQDPRTGNERLYYGDFRDIHGLDVARLPKKEFFELKKKEAQSGGNFYGRKFYKHSNRWETQLGNPSKDLFECLLPETTLSGAIVYQGLTEDELGALLFALGLGWGHTIYHKLGYAKPAFFGSIELSVEPKALPRYENTSMTADEASGLAAQYYETHKESIEDSVRALDQEWSGIGENEWEKQDNKYGY